MDLGWQKLSRRTSVACKVDVQSRTAAAREKLLIFKSTSIKAGAQGVQDDDAHLRPRLREITSIRKIVKLSPKSMSPRFFSAAALSNDDHRRTRPGTRRKIICLHVENDSLLRGSYVCNRAVKKVARFNSHV